MGQSVAYYDGCTFATNTLEPGAADDSFFVAQGCVPGETTLVQAPSWVQDSNAEYGAVWINGALFGECWLIRQQLIENASRAMLLECGAGSQRIYRSGFEANTFSG